MRHKKKLIDIHHFNIDIASFELQYMLDGDKKISITITLNFYIVVNTSYLYNSSEEITI